jgi:hypothetical protein
MLLEKDDSGASLDGTIRIQRPGLTLAYTLAEPVRGVFRLDNFLAGAWFAVAEHLLPPDRWPFCARQFPGSSRVVFAAASTCCSYCPKALYVWTKHCSRSPFRSPYVPIDIEAINGYIIIACSTGRFYWLEPGSLWSTRSTSRRPRVRLMGWSAVRVGRRAVLGRRGVDRAVAAVGRPRRSIPEGGGRQYERGVLSRDTMQRFDNSLVWVGDDMIVYRAGSVPQRISDHGIEERLRKRNALAQRMDLRDRWAQALRPSHPRPGTFAYDASSQAWSEFATGGSVVGHRTSGCTR